jgi:hypothetical protein
MNTQFLQKMTEILFLIIFLYLVRLRAQDDYAFIRMSNLYYFRCIGKVFIWNHMPS